MLWTRYAVAVINKDRVVGHLMKGKKRKACEKCIIFPANRYNQFGKSGNYWESCEQRQNGMGMQVPCKIIFTGSKLVLDKLNDILQQLQ